jgi:hypothetical protein
MVAESTQETAIWRTSEAFIGPYAVLLAALGLCSTGNADKMGSLQHKTSLHQRATVANDL